MPIVNRYLKGNSGEPQVIRKYGLEINDVFGDVDANGTLQPANTTVDVDFKGVKNFGNSALNYTFAYNNSIRDITFSNLTELNYSNSLEYTFRNATKVRNVSFPVLTTINSYDGLNYTFSSSTITRLSMPNCTHIGSISGYDMADCCSGTSSLTSVDFSSLETVYGNYIFQSSFNNSGLTEIRFPKLQYACGNTPFSNAFYASRNLTTADFRKFHTSLSAFGSTFSSCTSLTNVDFSSYTVMKAISSSYKEFQYTFNGCSALRILKFPMLCKFINPTNCFSTATFPSGVTEIHFRTDVSSIIPTLPNYSTKWGATNATLYYDLVSTITVNGNVYVRDEDDSIYMNDVKTHVAWQKATMTYNNIVCTRNPNEDGVMSSYPYAPLYAWNYDATSNLYTKERVLTTTAQGIWTNDSGTTPASGNMTAYTNEVIYTVAGAEPTVGTDAYDASGMQAGTITAIS